MSRYSKDLMPSVFEVRRMAVELQKVETVALLRGDEAADAVWNSTLERYDGLYKNDQVRVGILIALAETCLEQEKALNSDWSGYGER